jgi:hypothetical protein
MAMFIFLIHPVQVAPVKWFAQRTTVMAATFYLVTYLLYLDFRVSKSPLQYGLSVLSLFLGLLCKPTVATLPLPLAATEVFLPDRSQQPCADGLCPESKSGLGATYARIGQEAKAIYHFRASVHLKPGNSVARPNLNRILLGHGQSGEPVR